jgi:tRNA-2-methylthio-N6-dimethylallyladenosine synthase
MNVLVENLTEDKINFFGRSEYMTPVILNGSEENIGKVVSVKITASNKNTLFGRIVNNSNQKVA